jgi:hypothetical protein
MKAIRLVEGEIVNPLFSNADKAAAIARGEKYEVRQFLKLPKGEIVDDPECWRLCVGKGAPLAPADDECKERVLKVMSAADRKDFLQTLVRLNHPDVRKQQSKNQLEWLDMMVEIYSDEMDELQNPKPAKAAPSTSPKPALPVANT